MLCHIVSREVPTFSTEAANLHISACHLVCTYLHAQPSESPHLSLVLARQVKTEGGNVSPLTL